MNDFCVRLLLGKQNLLLHLDTELTADQSNSYIRVQLDKPVNLLELLNRSMSEGFFRKRGDAVAAPNMGGNS